MSTVEPSWRPDPSGRHEYRWWDGTAWSDVVADQGVEQSDPFLGYHADAGPTGRQQRRRSDRQLYGVLGIAAVVVVALLVVSFVVLGDGGDDGTGDGGDRGNDTGEDVASSSQTPREALIDEADMPEGWTVSDVEAAPSENLICEPRPEPPTPPRESKADFERGTPPGGLSHRVTEYTPEFAGELFETAREQADTCGTWDEQFVSGGETYHFTATAELVDGPTLGDQTVWYAIDVSYDVPSTSTHAVLVCLDRHAGVLSQVTLSTAPPTTETDRTLVEDLCRTASGRLDGTGS